MKKLSPILIFILIAALMVLLRPRSGVGAHPDLDVAVKRAGAENKSVFIAFVGSDWCDWCIKFDQEIYSTPVFQDFAASNLVLVKIDFPRNSGSKPPAQRKRDSRMANHFRVQGFPTVFILDSEGNPVAKTGYQCGGPEAYVAHINSLISE